MQLSYYDHLLRGDTFVLTSIAILLHLCPLAFPISSLIPSSHKGGILACPDPSLPFNVPFSRTLFPGPIFLLSHSWQLIEFKPLSLSLAAEEGREKKVNPLPLYSLSTRTNHTHTHTEQTFLILPPAGRATRAIPVSSPRAQEEEVEFTTNHCLSLSRHQRPDLPLPFYCCCCCCPQKWPTTGAGSGSGDNAKTRGLNAQKYGNTQTSQMLVVKRARRGGGRGQLRTTYTHMYARHKGMRGMMAASGGKGNTNTFTSVLRPQQASIRQCPVHEYSTVRTRKKLRKLRLRRRRPLRADKTINGGRESSRRKRGGIGETTIRKALRVYRTPRSMLFIPLWLTPSSYPWDRSPFDPVERRITDVGVYVQARKYETHTAAEEVTIHT